MNPSPTWYNAERVSQPGSVILKGWLAERTQIKAAGQHPLSSGTYGSELYEWMTGGRSSAGPAVTERSAMAIAAVYACVSLISGATASLPLPIYERTADGRRRVDHNLWWLFNKEPTKAMSAAVFWEFMIQSLMIHGDAFARIRRVGPSGKDIGGFEPLHPLSEVAPYKTESGRLAYKLTPVGGAPDVVDQDDMLHIPGLGFNGVRGMSPLREAARQMFGMSLAADEYSARFFSNGARPDYVVTIPGKLDKDQQALFRESWMSRYSGVQNAHIPAILQGGGEVKALSLNPEDAQLIQTRGYQAADIARFYGVPGHMIGINDKTTSWGSGIEQMSIGFVKYTLQRHLVKIEQEINRKCFRTAKYFAEFSTAGLERGDYKARNEGYRIALGRAGEPAWMTVNEVRKLENLPPQPGGDVLPETSLKKPAQQGDANAPAP